MPTSEDLLLDFLTAIEARGLSLYPAQEAAILELLDGKNVILNTPTGSGKSLVASMLHRQALALGRKSVYTCPIKALVNEKWMALCKEFGPENVGLSTGDATVNHDAPILCCTAEILSNIALCEGADSVIRDVVMDEFHYYSDRERGVAWQIPLLAMPNTRFLLMSATLGETDFFEGVMTRLNGLPSVTVRSRERPVPLDFTWSDSPLPNAVQKMVNEGKAPIYVVHFTQAEAAGNAQNFTSLDLCTKEDKAALAAAIAGFRFSSPYGPDLKRWLRQGIGLHHAGLLPKYRILMEKLAQKGLLKVICGTDTLGVGVNVPIRTVLFTQLCKYSGDKTAILTARDFHQISGRAGRKGFDNVGYVVAQAPEHVIENIRLTAKAAQSGRKFQKKQPPERGYVPWDEGTFRRLIDALPEKLVSRFAVSHGMLLNVLSRKSDGCAAMRALIRDCHDTNKQKGEHKKRAFQLFRSLVERGIIGFVPAEGPGMAKVKVHADLGEDFTMHQQLSLWLLDTIPLLKAEDPDYHLDLLTLVESILENPEIILRRQLDMVKTAAMAEMKAQGLEYDERIAKLDEMEYPKPLREFVYNSFNEFSDKHPWVGNDNIQPKSIAREMFEEFLTFSGYIKRYGLERSEGLLLRHLNGVYKVLAHTVPDGYKNDAVWEIETYLAEMIHRVDSSLLDEWERLRNPDFVATDFSEELLPPGAAEAAADITRDEKKFTAAIRARIFEILSALWRRNVSDALDCLCEDLPEGAIPVDGGGERWTERRLIEQLALYTSEHGAFRLDAEGRALRYTVVEKYAAEGYWKVQQMLQDHNELNDWCVEFRVDLAASRDAEAPMMTLEGIREAI